MRKYGSDGWRGIVLVDGIAIDRVTWVDAEAGECFQVSEPFTVDENNELIGQILMGEIEFIGETNVND